jgi:flagellar hook assembly protein FlgD
VVSKINVTRGPVYFLDGSVAVFANAPQLFNASSTTLTFIPPYEINFSISRAAQVEVAIVALEPNMCSPVTDNVLSSNVNVYESRTNAAGEICKFLSTMTIANTGHFDANAIRKIYWDGTDHTGNYVKPGIYEVRLTARNYPDAGLYDPTVKSITLNADLLKVFDLLEADNYAISERGQNMKIGYQVSVPMKVAIQIFKPGTTIFDYSKGTLRNPTTGLEVQDIREVLVRSIVGIRPGTTLVEEVWDGLDYAGQEVPDGIYPFRFVTSLDTAAIDTVTGEVLFGDDTSADPMKWKIQRVADTYEYQNLHKATIAIGDGRFVCDDWKKTVFFYPNPLNDASKGTLEITKMPVPGTISIKYFNLAGDLVRNADYDCVDANNYRTTIGSNFYFQPDNNISTTRLTNDELVESGTFRNVRNAALRCKWDRTNQHGKKVARGVYFGLVDFKAYNGREHCQKVVKILIP